MRVIGVIFVNLLGLYFYFRLYNKEYYMVRIQSLDEKIYIRYYIDQVVFKSILIDFKILFFYYDIFDKIFDDYRRFSKCSIIYQYIFLDCYMVF